MSTVLITGISGSLARLTAKALLARGEKVIGVDYRPKPAGLPEDILFCQANYNKSRIADVFRRHKPERVLHLGRVGNLFVRANKRFDLNVVGSAKIQTLSVQHNVRQLVVLSTFHIYGAHPHNHVPIFEDEPLRGTQTIPQLGDAIQLDNQAVAWTYRHPDMATIVLRPTNVIGAHIENTISRYLRAARVPYISGYNPMWQFIDENDMLDVLLLALYSDQSGIFNVAGNGALPIVEAIRTTGRRPLAIPWSFFHVARKMFTPVRTRIPPYMVDFLRFPVIIGDNAFREQFGFKARIALDEALHSCVGRIPLATSIT